MRLLSKEIRGDFTGPEWVGLLLTCIFVGGALASVFWVGFYFTFLR